MEMYIFIPPVLTTRNGLTIQNYFERSSMKLHDTK